MIIDADLGLAPFMPITEADRAPARLVWACGQIDGLPHITRVLIAYVAAENPRWDAVRIGIHLDVRHDVTIHPEVIETFLARIQGPNHCGGTK